MHTCVTYDADIPLSLRFRQSICFITLSAVIHASIMLTEKCWWRC